MNYGRDVGYIGALAVALGVGSAVATPGIAYGLPADTGSESPAPGETSPTDPSAPPSPMTPSSPAGGAHLSSNSLVHNGLRLLAPDLASRVAGAVSTVIGGGRGAPVVVLRSSGGARTSTNDGSSARRSTLTTGSPVSGDHEPGLSLPKAPKRPLHVLGDDARTQTVP